MPRKTIGLDCDGVLYDFVGAAAKWSGFDKEKATDFDIFKAWGAPGLWDAFDEYAQRKGFCEGLQLEDGATKFYRSLTNIADVVFVTSPYRDAPAWAYERERALRRDFGVTRESVLSMRSKQYARVDVLIDDKPGNIKSFPGETILFDQPWNRDFPAPIRAHGYDDTVRLVREILK